MGPGEGVVVTQFQLPDWPEHGRPISTGAVVEMLDMITKAQMNTGNRAITILCKSVHPLVSVYTSSVADKHICICYWILCLAAQ